MKAEREKKQTNRPPAQTASPLRFGRMARHLIDTIPLGVVVFDRQLHITDINSSAKEMLAEGNDIAEALTVCTKVSGTEQGETTWRKRLEQSLAAREPSTFENVAYSNNGATGALQIICTPLVSESSDEQLGGILLIEDVTKKMMMENDLAQAERLAAMGKLAARVAHELNNPLDGILRYINLALRIEEQTGNQQSGKYLREARKGVQRMVQIISELLEFSRSTYTAFEEADINKIAEEAVKSMETQALKNQVEIVRDYGKEMPNLRSGNLFQVFCNLIKNAIDAMSNGGQLTIKTHCREKHLLIEFADTGCGLSREVQENLFEPFFTTKDAGKGTGLGLPICKDIIERYNGEIEVRNRPEGGALFTVSIPLERTSGMSI